MCSKYSRRCDLHALDIVRIVKTYARKVNAYADKQYCVAFEYARKRKTDTMWSLTFHVATHL